MTKTFLIAAPALVDGPVPARARGGRRSGSARGARAGGRRYGGARRSRGARAGRRSFRRCPSFPRCPCWAAALRSCLSFPRCPCWAAAFRRCPSFPRCPCWVASRRCRYFLRCRCWAVFRRCPYLLRRWVRPRRSRPRHRSFRGACSWSLNCPRRPSSWTSRLRRPRPCRWDRGCPSNRSRRRRRLHELRRCRSRRRVRSCCARRTDGATAEVGGIGLSGTTAEPWQEGESEDETCAVANVDCHVPQLRAAACRRTCVQLNRDVDLGQRRRRDCPAVSRRATSSAYRFRRAVSERERPRADQEGARRDDGGRVPRARRRGPRGRDLRRHAPPRVTASGPGRRPPRFPEAGPAAASSIPF